MPHESIPLGPATHRVFVFVDLANLIRSAALTADQRGEAWAGIRLHAQHLFRVLAAGRAVGRAVVVADASLGEGVLIHFRRWFPDVRTVERGALTGRQQGGDEILLTALYETIHSGAHGTIVLATGDGAGWGRGQGFCQALLAARQAGFGVEVAAFRVALNKTLRELASEMGALIELDDHYAAVTFVQGLRYAVEPTLRRRMTAEPSSWTAREARSVELIRRRGVAAASKGIESALPLDDPGLEARLTMVRRVWRAAWPLDAWGSRHLQEWLDQLLMPGFPARDDSEGGIGGWMNDALDRVGLAPEAQTCLIDVIEAFFTRLSRGLGTDRA